LNNINAIMVVETNQLYRKVCIINNHSDGLCWGLAMLLSQLYVCALVFITMHQCTLLQIHQHILKDQCQVWSCYSGTTTWCPC